MTQHHHRRLARLTEAVGSTEADRPKPAQTIDQLLAQAAEPGGLTPTVQAMTADQWAEAITGALADALQAVGIWGPGTPPWWQFLTGVMTEAGILATGADPVALLETVRVAPPSGYGRLPAEPMTLPDGWALTPEAVQWLAQVPSGMLPRGWSHMPATDGPPVGGGSGYWCPDRGPIRWAQWHELARACVSVLGDWQGAPRPITDTDLHRWHPEGRHWSGYRNPPPAYATVPEAVASEGSMLDDISTILCTALTPSTMPTWADGILHRSGPDDAGLLCQVWQGLGLGNVQVIRWQQGTQ